MVKTILQERDVRALDYFLTNVVNKSLGEKSVPRYMSIMNNLYENGLFTSVFLEEMRELGLSLYPIEDQDACNETEDYAEHLNVLATRQRGEKGKANPFIGKRIKVGYLLIAETEKLREQGFVPYLTYVWSCIEMGAEAIYLLAQGRKVKIAKKLANNIARKFNMKIVNNYEYKDTKDDVTLESLCIELRKIRAPPA